MIFYKTQNELSKFQQDFISFYREKNKTHKIFVEYNLLDYINKKEEEIGIELDLLIKKRCSKLRFDVFDSTLNIVFEICGDQHYKFNKFFHKDIGSFDRQKSNDFIKKYVCDFFDTKYKEVRTNDFK